MSQARRQHQVMSQHVVRNTRPIGSENRNLAPEHRYSGRFKTSRW